ncbi:EAL domain-containing response regulator [Candidatus Nucleicultrix amoebiphila]|jgi:EAL domain-containing protein (putative c-di-GMP-specific phosphodiesterase class I)|uniref:Response regulatory domain-containing protein n=1 Tax=Candidatus Nucleicultrix amoebiphila FS5 TaxID=1414854 RepID=A0A1W6N2Z9_9PROT|nr:EAL domain-containing response regulator [Candidatus Nucleicultrix amoebiphila]ARN84159.1 hypothetical protein GQ61_01050 [Candidatus Nucleicultrix amoebiphila FS5]
MHIPSLLIVDDDFQIIELLQVAAERMGYKVYATYTASGFKELYPTVTPHLIFIDLKLGDHNGIELLEFLILEKCSTPIILMSGQDEKVLHIAKHLGDTRGLSISGILHKPFNLKDFVELIEKAKKDSRFPDTESIKNAVEQNEMFVAYQPKISIQSGKFIGVETLLRWTPFNKDFISPSIFIPIAEEEGFIKELTFFMLDNAFKDYALWRQEEMYSLAINISLPVLNDSLFLEQLHEKIKAYKISPNEICLEITESYGITEDSISKLSILTKLRIQGFKIALDDFGTGYSSLLTLHRVPFTEIKIDKSFILDLFSNSESLVITKAIINLSHALGLKVVAEGIESFEVYKKLKELGCDEGQGYYFSNALSVEDLQDWINTHLDKNQKFKFGS